MAVAVGLFIVIDSFSTGDLLLTLGFAALYFAGGFLAYRDLLAGFVLLVVLFAMDAAFIPFYERTAPRDWFAQALFGLLNLTGLIATVAVMWRRRHPAAYR
jgi:hypothetical protein